MMCVSKSSDVLGVPSLLTAVIPDTLWQGSFQYTPYPSSLTHTIIYMNSQHHTFKSVFHTSLRQKLPTCCLALAHGWGKLASPATGLGAIGCGHIFGRGLSLFGEDLSVFDQGELLSKEGLFQTSGPPKAGKAWSKPGHHGLTSHWQEKAVLVAAHTREMAITRINAFQFSIWKIKGQKLSLFVAVFGLGAITVPFNDHATDVFRPTEYISSVTKCATQSALKIVLLLKWHTSSGNLWPPLKQKMDTTFLTEESKSKATHYP